MPLSQVCFNIILIIIKTCKALRKSNDFLDKFNINSTCWIWLRQLTHDSRHLPMKHTWTYRSAGQEQTKSTIWVEKSWTLRECSTKKNSKGWLLRFYKKKKKRGWTWADCWSQLRQNLSVRKAHYSLQNNNRRFSCSWSGTRK